MEAVKGEAKALREVLQQQSHSQQDSEASSQQVTSLKGQLAEAERRCREAEEQLTQQLPEAEGRRREAEEKLRVLEQQLVRQLLSLPLVHETNLDAEI